MRHVYMTKASRDYQTEWEDNQGVVHYDGVFLIGSATLCAYTDLVGCEWAETNKRVNCPGCLATRAHVLGIEYKRPKRSSTVTSPNCQQEDRK